MNAAGQSLSVLDKAWRGVSASLHSYTLVATKATAGLHLLGAQESTEILNAVERHLVSTYPFILSDRGAVAIMDGGDEGVYAWISASYLLDMTCLDLPVRMVPYAALDLGGGSTQAVFKPERAARNTG